MAVAVAGWVVVISTGTQPAGLTLSAQGGAGGVGRTSSQPGFPDWID